MTSVWSLPVKELVPTLAIFSPLSSVTSSSTKLGSELHLCRLSAAVDCGVGIMVGGPVSVFREALGVGVLSMNSPSDSMPEV